MIESTQSPASHSTRRKRLVVVVLGGALLGCVAGWWWLAKTRSPGAGAKVVDPRLTYPTIYRNVRPDVKYVGDRACADCHAGHAESYHHHPMGRALAPVAQATEIEHYDPKSLNPFTAFGLRYEVKKTGARMVHREHLPGVASAAPVDIETAVHFAIGSGIRARSYAVSYDGYLFQSPITWFPQERRWDLSPSYELRNQHFSRAIAPGCLFCHANQVHHVPDTLNRYRAPIFDGFVIGCERCHGPGELHVARRTRHERFEGIDDTIVNPARLEHSLREAVCQQCHIQGEQRVLARGREDFDYRPGLPLHLFLMDFVDGSDRRADHKFVSSVEQLMVSRCYEASREPKKLGCTSCHDPHRHPTDEEKAAHYRQRCLQCHTEASCGEPAAARREVTSADSCIECHMPALGSEVNHSAITDHRIPRRGGRAKRQPAPRVTPGAADLIPFHRHLLDANDPEVERNRGIAVVAMIDRGPPAAIGRRYGEFALPLLDKAVKRDPGDWPAVQAHADALWLLDRRDEAMKSYERILAARPTAETILSRAGDLALEMDDADLARAYFTRAVAINPWRSRYHHGLAVASFRLGEISRAVAECKKALKLEPTSARTRSLLVQCRLAQRATDEARAEYDTIRQLTSAPRRPDLERWFAEQLDRFGQ
ncbi:MAG: tetratricopeptide repeat protein [Gemmataceae bacterium]|nr:tetratricopeptide repeat protein [Gemmataceae bacterium]